MASVSKQASDIADRFAGPETYEGFRDELIAEREAQQRSLEKRRGIMSRMQDDIDRERAELEAMATARDRSDRLSTVGAFAAPGLGPSISRIGSFAAPADSLAPFGQNFAELPGLPSRNPNAVAPGFARRAGPDLPSRNPNMAMRGGMPGVPSAKPSGHARLDGLYGVPTRTAAYSPSMRARAPEVRGYSKSVAPSQRIAAALMQPAQNPFGDGYSNPFAGRAGSSYAAGGVGRGAGAQSDPFGGGGWASDAFGW